MQTGRSLKVIFSKYPEPAVTGFSFPKTWNLQFWGFEILENLELAVIYKLKYLPNTGVEPTRNCELTPNIRSYVAIKT
jgi:hypothetical protein